MSFKPPAPPHPSKRPGPPAARAAGSGSTPPVPRLGPRAMPLERPCRAAVTVGWGVLALLLGFAGTASARARAALANPPVTPSQRVQKATALVLIRAASGSGFVIASDETRYLLVTNAHVLVPPGGMTSIGVTVVFDPGTPTESTRLQASILGQDKPHDLALLSVPKVGPERTPLPLAVSLEGAAGTAITAAGYPFGTDLAVGRQLPAITLNSGRVLAVYGIDKYVELDVGINPGNSGGPVVDTQGTVLGVVAAHYRNTEKTLAIHAGAVRDLVDRFGGGVKLTSRPVAKAPTSPGATSAPARGAVQHDLPPRYQRAFARFETSAGHGLAFIAGRGGNQLILLTADLGPLFAMRTGGIEVTLGGDYRKLNGRILGATRDVAALGVPAGDYTFLSFALTRNNTPAVGEPTLLVGPDPNSLADRFKVMAKSGTLSSVRVDPSTQEAAVLQFDFGYEGAIAGGLTFNAMGEATGIAPERGGGHNITLAAPMSHAWLVVQTACAQIQRESGTRKALAANTAPAAAARHNASMAILQRNPGPSETAKVARAFKANCGTKHAESCRIVAYLYWNGRGVPQDKAKAIKIARKACAMGSNLACGDLFYRNNECF